MNNNLRFTIIIVLAIILGFALSQIMGTKRVDNLFYGVKYSVPESEDEIVEKCKNLELEDTAKCLVDNIKTFYKFDEDSPPEMTFSELKDNGGRCYNWANLYVSLGNQLGFKSKRLEIPFIPHTIAILSDGNDYCMIDQRVYWCRRLR